MASSTILRYALPAEVSAVSDRFDTLPLLAAGKTATYTFPANGRYLITTGQLNNASKAADGLWLASVHNASHITSILAPTDGTTLTVSARTLTVTAGTRSNNQVRVTRL